jgi:tetratricopeptide (TPR) repeat protein
LNAPDDYEALYYKAYCDYELGNYDGAIEDFQTLHETNPEYAEVFTDVSYAAAQQGGNDSTNLPARPYMPVHKDGTFPAYTLQEVTEAARNQLFRSFA